LNEIALLAQKWDCLVITDEIYEHIYMTGPTCFYGEPSGMGKRTITINSISQNVLVTGWRVGWAIADASITKRIRKVHDFLTVGAPTPLQHAAAFALDMPVTYYTDLAAKYLKSRDRLFKMLKSAGFEPSLPKGAYYIIAGTDRLMKEFKVKDDFKFSHKLIQLTKVATVPGTSFYANHKKKEGPRLDSVSVKRKKRLIRLNMA